MNGLLLINKPLNWTSFDVVAKVRGIVKKETGVKRSKVGHAGTLDPLATGLLIILVGDYCKRAQDYSKLDKVYQVEITLGQTSTTDDGEGEKTAVSSLEPDPAVVTEAVERFVGTIEQVPPVFSAIKVDGKRAYKLARAGQEVKMQPRQVTIHSIDDLEYNYPTLRFTTNVSSGTYIRSLARDIGDRLTTGAYMSGLVRVSIADFTLDDAHSIEDVTSETIRDYLVS